MKYEVRQERLQDCIAFFHRLMIAPRDRGRTDSLSYGRRTAFVALMLILLPAAFPEVLKGILRFYKIGAPSTASAILLYYAFFWGLAFFRSIPLPLRVRLFSWALYAVGIGSLLLKGPYGAGPVYLCLSYAYSALNAPRSRMFLPVGVNAFVLSILSLFYTSGSLAGYGIVRYGGTWGHQVFHLIVGSVLITLATLVVLKEAEQLLKRERVENETLRRSREERIKQIRLLQSLRQMGNCLADTRLEISERLLMMQKKLGEELPLKGSAVSLGGKDAEELLCLTSLPDGLRGRTSAPPDYTGPFLMHRFPEGEGGSAGLLKNSERGGVYFGSHFYTPDQRGYLELLLEREPDASELEYLQMNLFQLSGAMTNRRLIRQMEENKALLEHSYDEILRSWAHILEMRDIESKGHSDRIVKICMKLADLLNIPEGEKRHLRRGILLHDIGKLGIPDSILQKEEALSQVEWEIMRRHPQIGREAVENIPFLKPALPVISSHHERWDGRGYPEGLVREQIPIPARIFTIADVYDSLTSDRPYRKALGKEDALSYMQGQKGQIFDPELLDIFLRNAEEITVSLETGGF